MWTATINQVRNEQVVGGRMRTAVNVTLTDGIQKSLEDFLFTAGTKEAVYAAIQGRLDDLNAITSFKVDIPIGPFVPVVPATPDPLRVAYAADLRLYQQMSSAIQIGVKTAADKDYTDCVARLKTNYLVAYLDLF